MKTGQLAACQQVNCCNIAITLIDPAELAADTVSYPETLFWEVKSKIREGGRQPVPYRLWKVEKAGPLNQGAFSISALHSGNDGSE
jgi:hypothetical protein